MSYDPIRGNNRLETLCQSLSTNFDPLAGIENYKHDLTISKVSTYFYQRNMVFTKPMIQSYVRMGLLPPPLDGRDYVPEHLMILAMLHFLKKASSLEDVKSAFKLALEGPSGNVEMPRDSSSVKEIYNVFQDIKQACEESLARAMPDISLALERLRPSLEFDAFSKKGEECNFMHLMALMCLGSAVQRMQESLIKEAIN
ncbi:MAG: DUF1836 domain-containing protein [Clostridiales bacterium]|jgi:DNA-binding transcriptional MerR regulator|nr:DUF1836 domain-containing protein [Clostridiales bacterium]